MHRNTNFDRFILAAKQVAAENGLKWSIEIDADGWVRSEDIWDMDRVIGAPQSKKARIRDLGADRRANELINQARAADGAPTRTLHALDAEWTDLLKAVAIDWVILKKNRTSTLYDSRLRPLRILAACSSDVVPWQLTVDHVRFALSIASQISLSTRVVLESAFSHVFDHNYLADQAPLLTITLAGQSRAQHASGSRSQIAGTGDIRKRLDDRKSAEKLPEMHAFWELVRIVFTEEPKTYLDALRFDHCRILICTGFRVSESCIIPADWRRERTFMTSDGQPASVVGGISRSLSIRHFAEKQRGKNEDSQVLFEATQHVPQIFEDIVEEAFDRILSRTEPLRKRLKQQTVTGRLFPEYDLDDLVPVGEVYPRLSGDLRLLDDTLPEDLVTSYKKTFDPKLLDELWATQLRPADRLRKYAVNYFFQFGTAAAGRGGQMFPARQADGSEWDGPVYWVDAYVRIRELEAAVHKAMPRKLPDTTPYALNGRQLLYPHELLLLTPKGSWVDQRNGQILDVNRYFAVGTVSDDDLRRALGSKQDNLFSRYGQAYFERNLTLTRTHTLRHLQNTELFRLGLADTIITKRFNRRSVQQSYVYDHRSLAEDLDAIDLPAGAIERLPPKAQETLRLIKSGLVTGPIIDEFKRVQAVEGEDAAFEYLAAEADGFHATPYGYCVNSFTVDPCPKHLECFNGCRHLTKSSNAEHKANLDRIEFQLETAIHRIEARPIGSIGRDNQLADARRKLGNVRKIKIVKPGDQAFKDGADLSEIVGQSARRTAFDNS
jgi:hypothetical protein